MVNLGTIIKELRLKRNLKQVDLANTAGISNSYLSDIENNRTEPSLKTLMKIAKALEVRDMNFFLGIDYVNTEHTQVIATG